MKLTTFDMLRVWASLTGLTLALCYLVLAWLGTSLDERLPMLIAGIGGFELVLFAQDRWLMRRAQRG